MSIAQHLSEMESSKMPTNNQTAAKRFKLHEIDPGKKTELFNVRDLTESRALHACSR
jgi:hypothetical protein